MKLGKRDRREARVVRDYYKQAWDLVEAARPKKERHEEAYRQATALYDSAYAHARKNYLDPHFLGLVLYGRAYGTRQLKIDKTEQDELTDRSIEHGHQSGTNFVLGMAWQEKALTLRYPADATEADLRTALNFADYSIGYLESAYALRSREFEREQDIYAQRARAYAVKSPIFKELANKVDEPERRAANLESVRLAEYNIALLTRRDMLKEGKRVEPFHTLAVAKTGLVGYEKHLPPSRRALLQSALLDVEEARENARFLPTQDLYLGLLCLREADLRAMGEPENVDGIRALLQTYLERESAVSPPVHSAVAGNSRRVAALVGGDFPQRVERMLARNAPQPHS